MFSGCSSAFNEDELRDATSESFLYQVKAQTAKILSEKLKHWCKNICNVNQKWQTK